MAQSVEQAIQEYINKQYQELCDRLEADCREALALTDPGYTSLLQVVWAVPLFTDSNWYPAVACAVPGRG